MSHSLCVKAAKATKNHLHDLMPLVTTIYCNKKQYYQKHEQAYPYQWQELFLAGKKDDTSGNSFQRQEKKIPLQKLFSQVRI